jgi:hypothetical protein
LNSTAKLRAVETAETPAAIAHREHEATLAVIDHDIIEVRAKISQTTHVLTAAKLPAARLAALDERLSQAIAARYSGEKATEVESDLSADIDAAAAEVAAQAPTVRGATLAIEKLNGQLANLSNRRAAELDRRRFIQLAKLEEMLTELAASGEQAVAPFLAWLSEVITVGALRDRLRLPTQAPCVMGLSPKFRLPTPINFAAFDELAAERNLAVAVEARGAVIAGEMGIDLLGPAR